MFEKKKNRPDLGSRFSSAYGSGGTLSMLICGAILLAVFFIVRWVSGSPYAVMERLRLRSCIPPVFVTTLLFSLWFLAIGGAFGLCLGMPCRGRETEKYKGGMLFILLAVLELVWYPCFFIHAELFFSFLLCLLCVVLCFGVFLCFRRVARLSAVILLFHTLWLIYLTVICLVALFRL